MKFTFTINGGDHMDAEKEAVSLHSRVLQNMAADVVNLTVYRKPSQPAIFAHDDKVVIYRDGVRWFSGRASSPVKFHGAQGYGHGHQITGPWQLLERSIYNWTYDTPEAFPGDGYPLKLPPTTQRMWAMMAAFITTTDLAGEFAQTAWPTDVPAAIYYAYPTAVNVPLADNYRTIASYHLKSCIAWDYSTTPPTLQVRGIRTDRRTIDAADVSEINLARRDDLAVKGVELRLPVPAYFDDRRGAMTLSVPQPTDGSRYPADCVTGSLDVLPLEGSAESYVYNSAVAHYIFNQLSAPVWEGQITLRSPLSDTALVPGCTINLANLTDADDPLWGSMDATIIKVSEGLLDGQTIIELGSNNLPDATTAAERFLDWSKVRPWIPNNPWLQFYPPIYTTPLPV